MKYRFRVSKRRIASQNPPLSPRRLRLKGRKTLCRTTSVNTDEIRFFSLFERDGLPCAPKKKRVKRAKFFPVKKIFSALRRALQSIGTYFVTVARDLKAILTTVRESSARKKKQKRIHTLPILGGFLCAITLVFAVSAGTILLAFFAPYGRSYIGITIPDFVGQSEQKILTEQQNAPHLNLIVQYETNPDVPTGHVISQIPRAGAIRRIYEKEECCNVTLTVSRPTEPYVLENLVGKDERDALLLLRNQSLSVSLTEVDSPTVAAGCVVRTEPSAGSRLWAGDSVKLQISRGKQETRFSVPNLVGMNETDATFHLRSAGFSIDRVSYQTSTSATGTILSQDPPAYTHAPSGSAVSLVVSIGTQATPDTVPDLFGLSLKDARTLASQYGLEIEKVYTVPSPALAGTVLRQSPTHGSTISASARRITIYVSS